MNPLQEKLNEIVKGLKDIEVDNYGKWKVDRNLACNFIEGQLKSAMNLTLEEAKKAAPEEGIGWMQEGRHKERRGYTLGFNDCSHMFLEALDKLKLE